MSQSIPPLWHCNLNQVSLEIPVLHDGDAKSLKSSLIRSVTGVVLVAKWSCCCYGSPRYFFGYSPGRPVALIGHNGAGKSTF